MSVYYCNQTNTGLRLLNRMLTDSGRPCFSRAEIGSGCPDSPEQILNLTALVNKEHDMQLKKSFEDDNGTIRIDTVLDNELLTEGFSIKEIGLFLLDEISGEEVLFSYTYFTGEGDFMPPGDIIRKIFSCNLYTGVSSTMNIKISTTSGVYATALDLGYHDENSKAHEKAFEKHRESFHDKFIVVAETEPEGQKIGDWWFKLKEAEEIAEPEPGARQRIYITNMAVLEGDLAIGVEPTNETKFYGLVRE